jgi:hypothetical protein
MSASMPVHDWVDFQATRRPEHLALASADNGHRLTWRQLVEELPRNVTGKVSRHTLRERHSRVAS